MTDSKKAQKKYPRHVRRRAKTSPWVKAPLIILAVVLSLYVLAFVAAPFFALRYIEQWYAEQGEGRALLIKGWTLSPVTGEVGLSDISASYPVEGGTEAEVGADFIGINLNLSALFEQTIHVQSLGITGLRFRGAQSPEGLSIAGIDIASSESPAEDKSTREADSSASGTQSASTGNAGPLPEGWSLRVDDISLTDDRVKWQQSGLSLTVSLSELTTGLFDSSTDDATPVSLDVTLEELSVDVGEETLLLREPVTLVLNAKASEILTRPSVTGDISLSSLALDVPGIEGVEFSALDVRGATFNMGQSGMTAGLQKLVLKNIRASLPEEEQAQLDQIVVSGVKWRSEEDDVALSDIELEGFSGNLAGFPQLSLAKFNGGDIKVTAVSSAPEASIGNAGLESLRAQHPLAGVMQLGDLKLIGIEASASNQNVSSLELNNLQVTPAEEDVAIVSLAHYAITDIAATPESFTSGIHRFYGLVSNITRLKDGSIKGIPAAEPETPDGEPKTQVVAAEQSESEENDDATATPFKVQIAGIQLEQNDSPSSFNWTDEAIDPTVNTTGRMLELTTGEIDSTQLEKGIDLNLLLALDDYNRIRATGTMGMKGEYPEGQMDVTIEQLNLIDFNPYLVQAMGYRLKKGMLGVDSDISIRDGQLGGNVLIKLQNSQFEPADDETIDRLSKQISMPVETALSVLKDDNNNIRLNVPLSGDISKPDVGINDVISKISQKALKTATLYYLKQSLVPYGQLISIASFAGDKLFAIRLNDLNYEAEQLDLTAEHKKYLDTVAEMMGKKTELELQVCPVASQQEVETWGDTWYSEVTKRGANVKAYLSDKEDKNGKSLSGRITVCAPQKGEAPKIILGV